MGKLLHSIRIVGIVSAMLAGVLWFSVGGAAAETQNVTQAYNTANNLHNGTIVRLEDDDAGSVAILEQTRAKDMLGVVTAANDAPVSLATETDQQQAYVATTGQYNVLVSNQEGAIKAGDFITISALHGVGMKATDADEIVIGKALGSFDGKTSVNSTATITSSIGTKRPVSIGHVRVDITVAHNPFYQAVKVDHVPSFLAKAAALVSKQQLSAIRIYAATALLIVTIVTAGFIIYAGVRNGMVAAGRNPLARKSIMRNVLQVIIVASIVFIIGLVAVYLVLKL